MKVFVENNSSAAKVISAVAGVAGVPLELQDCSKAPKGVPSGCCPNITVGVTTSGKAVFGCNSLARYIAKLRPEANLYGRGIVGDAAIDSFIDVAACLEAKTDLIISGKCEAAKTECLKKLDAFSESLEKELSTVTFLAGDRFSLGDIRLGLVYLTVVEKIFNSQYAAKFPSIVRWVNTVANHPSIALGDVKVGGGAYGGPSAVAAAPAPKAASSAPVFPESSFILDDFKREISNNPDMDYVMKYFWDHYDPNGFSLWHMKYMKYDDEGQVAWKFSNLMNGFLQRIDPALRKHAYGQVTMLGEDKDFDYEAVWLFRGTSVPPQIQDHVSYEYHPFRRLDIENEADRQLVVDFWTKKEGKIGGRPIEVVASTFK